MRTSTSSAGLMRRGLPGIGCLFALAVLSACGMRLNEQQSRGAAAIVRYGCGSCHTIRSVRGAHGLVGPPLDGVGARMYIAGMLENTPENLTAWIHNPKSINPKTAMPDMGISPRDASDIAAFLRTQ